ncbi:MAG: hypothetical protein ACR2FI_00360 [Burkholderiales bacterium]
MIKLNASSQLLSQVPQEFRNRVYYHETHTNAHVAALLTRQAIYGVEQEPTLVTDVEYATIAQNLWISNNQLLAEDFWKRAIRASPNEYFKSLNIRGYADFLFQVERQELGRKHYQQALDLLDNDTDFNKYSNAYTHQLWMSSEASNGFNEKADIHYGYAKQLFESVSHPRRKQEGLTGLEQLKANIGGVPNRGDI